MINKNKYLRSFFCCSFLFLQILAKGQNVTSLTIDSCYALARKNYPLIRQFALIDKTKEYSVENSSKGYLPQLVLSGQATHQSDVTKLPISLPGMDIPLLSKDQYKVYGEVTQPLTDAALVRAQNKLLKANAEIETQKVEVELFKLKERINQLFFAILLIDAQQAQMNVLKSDLQNALRTTDAAIANGVALKSNALLLEAELIKSDQRNIELIAMRKGYADMLGLLIHQNISSETKLVQPISLQTEATIKRPELILFERQQQTFDLQNQLITAKSLPHLNLFFQGGVGRPALNFLDNTIKGYYIGGIRLLWNLSGFYTYGKERKIFALTRQTLEVQKETFLFNTSLSQKQQQAEIDKMQELIRTDAALINLREKIKTTTKNQHDLGTATTTDYLNHLHAEDQAKINLLYHQIQLLLAQYNFQTTSGF